MIKFRYIGEDNKEYKSLDEVQNLSQRSMFDNFASLVRDRIGKLKLPNNCEGNATIIISVGVGLTKDIKIVNPCCTEFEKIIEPEINKINRNEP
jgi:hypothetical protein